MNSKFLTNALGSVSWSRNNIGNKSLNFSLCLLESMMINSVLKAKIQYLLTLQVGRYWLLALHGTTVSPVEEGMKNTVLKVIYHPLYGMNNYVLIWGDWLSCDPLRGSHDSQSPHIRKHLCPILGNFDLFVTKLFILYKG